MTEVYSTGVAMVFDNKPASQEKKRENKRGENNKSKMTREEFSNFVQNKANRIFATFGGRYAEFADSTFGMIVGILERKGRYFFLYLDKDRKIRYTDTKNFADGLYDAPPCMSILDYLANNDYKYVRAIVDDFLEREESIEENDRYKLVSKIRIGEKRNNSQQNDKKNGKNKKRKKGNKPAQTES